MKNTMEMNNKLNTEELTKVAGGTGPLESCDPPFKTGPLESCDPPCKTGPLESCDPPCKTGPLDYPYEGCVGPV